jgi:hypothetical protein
MRYEGFLVLILLLVTTSVSGLDRTSVADGNFDNPSTWDCTCIPALGDNVIINTVVSVLSSDTISDSTINSGGELHVSSGAFVVLGDLNINVGGLLNNIAAVKVRDDYRLDGTHSGNASLVLYNNGVVYGSGSFIKTGTVTFKAGNYTIDTSSSLVITTSEVLLKGNATINNYGDLTIFRLRGTGNAIWKNRPGSKLTITDYMHPSIRLRAQFVNNEIVFDRSSTQSIKNSEFGYYNLSLLGSSTSSIKRMYSNIRVNNVLKIETCTLDPMTSGSVYNITIGGAWNNVSGGFYRRTSTVNFTGAAGTAATHRTRLSFYNVNFSGSTTLLKGMEVFGTLDLTGNLDANGENIHMAGHWTSTGTITSGGGEVIFRGNLSSNVGGFTEFDKVRISKTTGSDVNVLGTMSILGTLFLDNGALNTNGNVIIGSNAIQTGRLAEVGSGILSGDLVVERYMNFPSNDWHLIGSSVTGMTVGDWSGDFITTGYAGSDYPGFWFNNITKYDESVPGHRDFGFVDVSSSSEAISPGEGRRAYIAAGYNKLSVSGPAIIGPFSWSIDFTDTGDSENDGWNLICNPYPSTIDWDDATGWSKFGVKDAIYVWGGQDGSYTSYIAGIGTNGGTQYIPSSQGFWVQTDTALPTLDIVESAKSDEDETFRTTASQYFKIKMTTSNGFSDEVAVRAHHDATMAFDSSWDAYEFKSADQAYPSISLTAIDNVDLSIYSLPAVTENTMIPMPIYSGASGEIEFEVLGGEDFPAEQLRLFDILDNKYYRLAQNRKVTLSLDEGDYTDRFFLVIDPLYENQVTSVRSSEGYNEAINSWISNDQIVIQNLNLDGSLVNITVVNSLGQIVYEERSTTLIDRKTIDASNLEGLLILQIDNLDTGNQFINRLVK